MTLANEYYLERLKQECESFISEGVDIENAAWLFELCDRYDAQQLKSFCFYFILSEFEAVSKTEAFQQLSPDVLEQISRISKTNEKDKKKDKKDKEKCSIN